MLREIWGELSFWLHVPILLVWFGLFFIPSSVWPGRIAFHFWYIMTLVAVQLAFGLFMMRYTRKFIIICPLTTLTQLLRGYKLNDPKNFGHSFVREFGARLHIKIPERLVGAMIFLSLGFACVLYALQ